MFRYVVMKDLTCGKPVYVASSEQDAALFLDGVEAESKGKTCERENSLTLTVSGKGDGYWKRYFVVKVKSWEPEPEVLQPIECKSEITGNA